MRRNRKTIVQLELRVAKMRKEILEMIVAARGTHIAGAFSVIDILVCLYDKVLHVDPKNPNDAWRDKFILSKGHGCAALYVTLANYGFFAKEVLSTYCRPGSILGGHPDSVRIPGVEASTGSLGHGPPVAVGFALANKIDGRSSRVYCLVGDGECNEGAVWEAVQVAAHHKLDNLVLIIDNNKLMIGGFTKDIIDPLSFKEKFEAFGWNFVEVDGHDVAKLLDVFGRVPVKNGKPTVVIADTVKGKGVSFMENDKKWHGALPNDEEMRLALSELDERIVTLSRR